MSVAKEAKQQDRPLELGAFLRELEKAGRITKAQFDDLSGRRRTTAQQRAHILTYLADQNLDDAKYPGKKLTLDALTRFLAEYAGQEFFHIDPLSIDAAKVTQVMSYAFTQRHKIMAVAVSPTEVTVTAILL